MNVPAGRGYRKTLDDEPNRPARPEQRDSFEKGLDHKPDPPEENLDPDFARGVREGEPGEKRRFSEGVEDSPDTPEKHVERRFSEGRARRSRLSMPCSARAFRGRTC